MSDYRMLAGIVVFIAVVLAILTSAAAEYPSLRPDTPSGWPPEAPTWNTPSWAPNTCSNIIGIDYLACSVAWFFGQVVAAFVFIASALGYLVALLFGLMSFRIPALPEELSVVTTVLVVGTIVVLSLLIFRLIRSVIPFVSGE